MEYWNILSSREHLSLEKIVEPDKNDGTSWNEYKMYKMSRNFGDTLEKIRAIVRQP